MSNFDFPNRLTVSFKTRIFIQFGRNLASVRPAQGQRVRLLMVSFTIFSIQYQSQRSSPFGKAPVVCPCSPASTRYSSLPTATLFPHHPLPNFPDPSVLFSRIAPNLRVGSCQRLRLLLESSLDWVGPGSHLQQRFRLPGRSAQ